MPDNDAQLSREQMKKFFLEIETPFRENEKEKRRSLEVSSGFFDKVAALSAGSIAVSASIILSVTAKPNVDPCSTRNIVHDLLLIAVLLWASLLLAIFHNFLAAQIAKLDAAISESEFQQKLATILFSYSTQTVDEATAAKAEDMVLKQESPKLTRNVKQREFLYPFANWVGHLSIVAFVIAYTLVVVYLRHLW